jgi:hypothetical protein
MYFVSTLANIGFTPVFCGLPCGHVTGQVPKPLTGLGLPILPKKQAAFIKTIFMESLRQYD